MQYEQVRVGILGVGQRGLQHLATLWSMQKDYPLQVVGLCDAWPDNLQPDKIKRFVPDYSDQGIQVFTRFEEMLTACALDALYVCLPPSVHKGEVIQAAQAGIHLFVEKPMSLYYDEAVAMEAAINASGVISTVGFNLRYHDVYETIRDFLSDKRIVMISSISHGTLESHSVKHTHTEEVGGPSNRVWTANYSWSGSAVVEAGIHTVDRMRYWCGDIAWVQSTYVPRDPDDIENAGDNPYACVVTLGFENGAIGTLHLTKLRRVFHNDGHEIILWNHGHLKIEEDGPVAYYYDGPYPPQNNPTPEQLRHPIPISDGGKPRPGINETFIQAVATGDASAIRSPFTDGMNSLAAVLASNASHDLQGDKIYLETFVSDPRYAAFRRKP